MKTTEKQIAANRRNAARSTGPISAAGKAIAARNSLKHGLLAQEVGRKARSSLMLSYWT